MGTLAEAGKGLFSVWGTRLNAIVDPNTMASSTLGIAPTYPITMVSGTAAIETITVPYVGFAGRITLIPTAVWTLTATTTGNIAVAVTTTVVSRPLDLIYNPVTSKWYPTYLS